MREKFLKPLVLALSAALFASCATLNKGKNQELTINSNVPGAIVELDGVELGYTPFKGKIKINKIGRVKVSKPGYVAGEFEVKKEDNDKDFIRGNVSLGFASAFPPYFAAGLDECSVDYPNRKADYENRKIKGEIGLSEREPRNNTDLIFFTGTAATGALAGFSSLIDLSTSANWKYSPSSYYVQLKEIDQYNSDYLDELAIRYFATMNHSQIAMDAGSNGEYAEALANIMEVKMDSAAARQGINEALEESKGDQVMFGDALMERFRR